MVNSSPAISVVMPVYNAGRFLAPALDSVLAQTFFDFELIAIDDGSTDDSGKVLADFAARDPRVRIFSQENQGIVATLNRALALARAPLVARMDADDICRADRFAKQLAYMQHHPEIAAISGAMDVIDESGTYLRTDAFPTLPDAIDSELLHRNCVCHPAVMARTEVLRSLGGYRRSVQYAEDYDLWLRISEVGRVANLPDVLLSHRVHAKKTSDRHFVAQELAVLAARGAARLRRRGSPDPLAAGEAVSPLGYRALQRMFADTVPRPEFALAFFSTVLGKTAEQGSITEWSRLYVRHGLWDLDRNTAATMILLLAHIMLRRRRAGAPIGELARFPLWALLTAICHPCAAVSAAMQGKSQILTRVTTPRAGAPAKSGMSA
jgi:GT2 family glycosyltransferase